MHIYEVIIDGFKSYASRTVVSGFDPHFNAITGLNGTGKSNILDSICFVLGISNLSQVRVGNLQELVYKQGQAGVTRASVTIVFDNNDVAGSPVGYESSKQITVTRQVVIGGKNKFMINGHTVQQIQIQNLFHSVQLNVNNPHFLIMQGRITKVLNMKPPETLSMIEEAAGTRMFETKKQAALKTIEKKQMKVDELTKVMEAEISPTLEKLRGDRQHYITWTSNSTELEQLNRFCVAHEYQSAEEKVKNVESDHVAMTQELETYQSTQQAMEDEVKGIESKIKIIEERRNNEADKEFQQMKKEVDGISKTLVKMDSTCKNQQELLQQEHQNGVSITKQISSGTTAITVKTLECEKANEKVARKEVEVTEAEQNVSSLQDKYQKACAGVAGEKVDSSGSEGMLSLPEQVRTWDTRAREAQSQLQQISMKRDHTKKSLSSMKLAVKNQQSEFTRIESEASSLRAKLVKQEKEYQAAIQVAGGFSEEAEAAQRNKSDSLREVTSVLQDKFDTLSTQLSSRLSFDYSDPERGFDRSKVKGVVAKLLKINDARYATALEIAAGAKLYQVVVDTENTGKMLLDKGKLKKRITILPLNKMQYRCVEPARLAAAKTIASGLGGTAHSALELISFGADVRVALEYVFGNVIICSSAAVAKAITFNKSINVRTVTYEGDSYEPGGTLTGGSTGRLGVLLSKVCELDEVQVKLASTQKELTSIVKTLDTFEATGSRLKELDSVMELNRHELSLCENKLKESSYALAMEEIRNAENELEQFNSDSDTAKATYTKSQEELKKLKTAEKTIEKQREQAMKDCQKAVKDCQKIATALKAELTKLKHSRNTTLAELEELKNEVAGLQDSLAMVEKNKAKLEAEVNVLMEEVSDTRALYDKKKEEVTGKQQELSRLSKEIKTLESEKEKCLKASENAILAARKLSHKLKQWEKDSKEAGKMVATLMKTNPWIANDKAMFGQVGSDYDFANRNVGDCHKRLRKIKEEQDSLAKKINKKVMGLIEKAEAESQELNRKKQVILNDKAKIEAVIEELDVKKQQALETTWKKVNTDFGSIFSMLLPGTTAKLEPMADCSVMDGLEVKVAFNNVWKDSLTELSGGQRSLLALSLILALLLFKPAPMYILDEVDAALDLSHTQNIGMMLRTHFSHSQFIVVSLKEGMFNNANVIFRTRFVDGISAVTRTVVGGGSRKALGNGTAKEADNEENVAPQKKKRSGK